jgi:DNA repair protein RadC
MVPDQECLTSILLNVRYAVIGWNLVSLGPLTESIAHPREVLRPAVAANAYAFVLAHNHPTGVPE